MPEESVWVDFEQSQSATCFSAEKSANICLIQTEEKIVHEGDTMKQKFKWYFVYNI